MLTFWAYGSGLVEALTVFSLETLSIHPRHSLLLQGKSVHSRSMDRSCLLRLWCSIRHLERAGSGPRVPSTVSCRRSTHSSSRPTTVGRGPRRQPGRSHTSELPLLSWSTHLHLFCSQTVLEMCPPIGHTRGMVGRWFKTRDSISHLFA